MPIDTSPTSATAAQSARVNIQSSAFRLDPYPIYSVLRKQAGVCKVDPGGLWAVVRHAEVARVLREHRVFSSSALDLSRRPWLGADPFSVSLAAMDPPAHTPLRRLGVRMTQNITNSSLASLTSRYAQPLTAQLSEGPCDFIASFAAPLLVRVMATLIGAPSLSPRIIPWVEALSAGIFIPAERTPDLLRTFEEMEAELTSLLEARLRKPGEDLVSGLVAAGADGRPPQTSDALGLLGLFLVAAYETTVQLLANIVLAWARHPAEFDRARSEPSLVPKLVEEVLRIEPPVHAIDRTANVDVELAGVRIPAGSIGARLCGLCEPRRATLHGSRSVRSRSRSRLHAFIRPRRACLFGYAYRPDAGQDGAGRAAAAIPVCRVGKRTARVAVDLVSPHSTSAPRNADIAVAASL